VSIVCAGGANVDRKYLLRGAAHAAASNPARASAAFGGVARNVAENLARLGVPVALLSLVGDDEDGRALIAHGSNAGIDMRLTRRVAGRATTQYAAVIDANADLLIAVSDMSLLDEFLPEEIERQREWLERAAWLFLDCNLPEAALHAWIDRARHGSFRLAIDAVSEPKIARLPEDLRGVWVAFLNDGEARAYVGTHAAVATSEDLARALVARGAANVVLTLGRAGAIVADDSRLVRLPAPVADALDATGAGDALVAATLWRLQAGDDLVDAARAGTLAAALTVESRASVRPDLSAALLEKHRHRLGAMDRA